MKKQKFYGLFCACAFLLPVAAQAQYIDTCWVGDSRTYTVDGGLEGSTYEWELDGGVQLEVGGNLYRTWEAAGVYRLSVTETTQYGCMGKKYTYLVLVSDEIENFEIQVPNVFTPNNDGQNDFFMVQGRNLTHYRIKIFNRWGKVLYESNDLHTAWDGTHNGTFCSEGVYYYTVTFGKNGRSKTGTGFFHLFQ